MGGNLFSFNLSNFFLIRYHHKRQLLDLSVQSYFMKLRLQNIPKNLQWEYEKWERLILDKSIFGLFNFCFFSYNFMAGLNLRMHVK